MVDLKIKETIFFLTIKVWKVQKVYYLCTMKQIYETLADAAQNNKKEFYGGIACLLTLTAFLYFSLNLFA